MEYPEELHTAFGKTLRSYREKAGLTQAALAGLAGTSTSYIGYLEAGKRMPTLATFLTLATVLRSDPHDFLDDTTRLMLLLQRQAGPC
jgi:transcriptional regulator with XRE-family HTH domain